MEILMLLGVKMLESDGTLTELTWSTPFSYVLIAFLLGAFAMGGTILPNDKDHDNSTGVFICFFGMIFYLLVAFAVLLVNTGHISSIIVGVIYVAIWIIAYKIARRYAIDLGYPLIITTLLGLFFTGAYHYWGEYNVKNMLWPVGAALIAIGFACEYIAWIIKKLKQKRLILARRNRNQQPPETFAPQKHQHYFEAHHPSYQNSTPMKKTIVFSNTSDTDLFFNLIFDSDLIKMCCLLSKSDSAHSGGRKIIFPGQFNKGFNATGIEDLISLITENNGLRILDLVISSEFAQQIETLLEFHKTDGDRDTTTNISMVSFTEKIHGEYPKTFRICDLNQPLGQDDSIVFCIKAGCSISFKFIFVHNFNKEHIILEHNTNIIKALQL